MANSKVDFIFVGAAKCGSTWFYDVLKDHPSIHVPTAKDIYFFDKFFQKGFEWYEKVIGTPSDFTDKTGEVSHDYLFSHEALIRIKEYNPNVKIMICIREPMERAYSAFRFMQRNGTTTDDFPTTLKNNQNIIERGQYTKYIQDCYHIFGKQNVKVFVFDDLSQKSIEVVEELYDFIGVDKEHIFEKHDKKSLPASNPRNKALSLAVKKLAILTRNLGHPNIVGKIKRSFISKLLYKEVKYDWYEEVSKKDKKWLSECFKSDVIKLQKVVDHDLSKWLNRYCS